MKHHAKGIWFGAAAALLANALVLLYGWLVQPLLSVQPRVVSTGVLGCAVVTRAQPLEGMLRFALLSLLLTGLGLALTSRSLRSGRDAWRSSRSAVATFLVLVCGVFFREPIRGGMAAGCAMACAFLAMGALPASRRRRMAEIAEFWSPFAFSGIGLAVALTDWLRVLGISRPAWWACATAPLAVVVLGGVLERVGASRDGASGARAGRGAAVIIAILWSLAPFTLWPAKPALAWIASFAIAFAILLCRGGRGSGRWTIAVPATSLVIPLTIVAVCGKHILGAVSLDDHHEAEQAIPGLLLLLGKTPLVHFHFIHSLLVDCLSSALAFRIWGVSIHALRMFREFVCSPLRGLLFWLILNQLWRRPFAAGFWLLLAGAGQFLVPHPREVLWLEPVLAVLLLFIHGERSRSAWAVVSAAALAPLAAALSPEVGLPVSAGLFLAIAMGVRRDGAHGAAMRSLVAFCAAGLTVLLVFTAFGMLHPFVRFILTRASVMTGLNARWSPQSALHPFLLARGFALAIMTTAWIRRGMTTPSARLLLPVMVATLAVTFGIMADDPERQWRFVGLDVIGVALAVKTDWRRYSSPAAAVLLLLAGMYVRPGNLARMMYHPRFESRWPVGRTMVDARLGALLLPENERAIWDRMAERFDTDEEHFNLSNYQLDYFLLGKEMPFPFVPLHVASSPPDQQVVVDALEVHKPRAIVWRTAWHGRYWGVAPYTLLFHIVDAKVLSEYAFDGTIGPYQILRREPCAGLRTYNDLLAPGARMDFQYGWAPYVLGLEGDRGMEALAPLLTGVPPHRRWLWTATIRGAGRAGVRFSSRSGGVNGPNPVRVEFALEDGEHRYVVPLWNLMAWANGQPGDWVTADVETSGASVVVRTEMRRLVQEGEGL